LAWRLDPDNAEAILQEYGLDTQGVMETVRKHRDAIVKDGITAWIERPKGEYRSAEHAFSINDQGISRKRGGKQSGHTIKSPDGRKPRTSQGSGPES
jgi:hypothetical protein